MNSSHKPQIIDLILDDLQQAYQGAMHAADQAHSAATDDQSVAETQYDTLAIEAAYLAHGQSQRVAECLADINAYDQLKATLPKSLDEIVLGCLVHLLDEDEKEKWIFFGPAAGGIKLKLDNHEVVVVTPSSPIGEALLGLTLGEEAEVHIGGRVVFYEVEAIY
ncbi:GreA/GreB family elongation factor [Photobacterium rosenbergii]|uniref:GreA/GreB family elongation factor n=1 Tax=Photobacterium rosenbergii TaxID=294936 RepID=UPI001C98EC24|nr:GreA/GreB family elongation factor [Photobacterium rosenbergii]MBY5945140.1 GreA/GreB family elongation factor [Photobacterium rosenbergii]